MSIFEHSSVLGRRGTPDRTHAEPVVAPLAWMAELLAADRACCCSAKPLVVAVLPATDDRPYRVELLLCGHHYRACRRALTAAGAVVYDGDGATTDDLFATP